MSQNLTKSERFTIIGEYEGEIGIKENRTGDVIVLKHNDLNAQQFVAQITRFLNEQDDAIGSLITDEKYWEQKAIQKIKELERVIEDQKYLLDLIANAHSFKKEESVKEILRNDIRGIDTVTDESAEAWKDYCILSKFFNDTYGEIWDNE